MSNEIKGTASILAALLVLFTAMMDRLWAAGLAVFALAALGIHEFARGRRQRREKEL